MSTDLTTFESYPAFALFLCGEMETITSDNGEKSFTRTKSDCPVWARSLIYSVKADNGEIYNALEVISDAVEDDIDDIASSVEADTYTSELLDWLVIDRSRCALVDDAVGEFGWSSLTEAISQAQVTFRDSLVRELYARLEAEERVKPADEDCDGEDK